MKPIDMDGDGRMLRVQDDVQRLKKTVNRALLMIGVLAFLVLVLLVTLIAVGASNRHRISNLQKYRGLVPHPNVTFASNAGNRTLNGLTYGGSLFRGTGFWGQRNKLPGTV